MVTGWSPAAAATIVVSVNELLTIPVPTRSAVDEFAGAHLQHEAGGEIDEGMWQGRFGLRAGRIVREAVWHDLAAIQRQFAGKERSR